MADGAMTTLTSKSAREGRDTDAVARVEDSKWGRHS